MDDVVRCPSCGDEFRLGTERCPDCRVELEAPSEHGAGAGAGAGDRDRARNGRDVHAVPATSDPSAPEAREAPDGPEAQEPPDRPAALDGPGGQEAPATLELHELTDEGRRLVDQLLTARLVRHSWQGSDLLVPARLAGEAELAIEQAMAASAEAEGWDGPTVVYEVAGWPVAMHNRLGELLEGAGITHQWEPNGDLVVSEADEDAVEALFDELDEIELAVAPDPLSVLDTLHGQLSRLSREPFDARARQAVIDAAEDLRSAALPFGFDPPVWRSLVNATSQLAEQLPALAPTRVRERAAALRDQLRSWL